MPCVLARLSRRCLVLLALLAMGATPAPAQSQRSGLGPGDRQAVARASLQAFETYEGGGGVGLAVAADECADDSRRKGGTTSPDYCLAFDLAAMRVVEEVEASQGWPSSPPFMLGEVMSRAGTLLESTAPPTGAQEKVLRPIMIAPWAAVNLETQAQSAAEMRKRPRR